jgi:hypothetical protein
MILFVFLNLFKFVIVQERLCLFKECYCNNSDEDSIMIECSDSLSIMNTNYHKLERNLRILINKEVQSLNISLLSIFITKSEYLYLPDYVFKFLNFKEIYIQGNTLFNTSIIISSNVFSNVGFITKIKLEQVKDIYFRNETNNPFTNLTSLKELELIGANFERNQNFIKLLAILKNTIKHVTLVNSLSFIPDLTFLTSLNSLSIKMSPIMNTTVYQIYFDNRSFQELKTTQKLPLNLNNFSLISIYELDMSDSFNKSLYNSTKYFYLSEISNKSQVTNIKQITDQVVHVLNDKYKSYLLSHKWRLDQSNIKFKEEIELTYSDYFILQYNITENITFSITTKQVIIEFFDNSSNITTEYFTVELDTNTITTTSTEKPSTTVIETLTTTDDLHFG